MNRAVDLDATVQCALAVAKGALGGDADFIDAVLAAKGTPIGPYDVLIAGQAMARDMILITHNRDEFGRVPGLRIEDWQS
jgi:hypothetical protein